MRDLSPERRQSTVVFFKYIDPAQAHVGDLDAEWLGLLQAHIELFRKFCIGGLLYLPQIPISIWVNDTVHHDNHSSFLCLQCVAYFFYSSPSSAAYMRQWTGSVLVQIMAWCLIGAKPLSKPMLVYVNWIIRNKLQWNFSTHFVCETASILSKGRWVNTLCHSDATWRHRSKSTLDQAIRCRFCVVNPLPKLKLIYCGLDLNQ